MLIKSQFVYCDQVLFFSICFYNFFLDNFGNCWGLKYDSHLSRNQRLLARNFMESIGVVYSIIRAFVILFCIFILIFLD